jgi:hypothetical protein
MTQPITLDALNAIPVVVVTVARKPYTCTVCASQLPGGGWVCSDPACQRKAEADYDARIERECDES